jgi:hypothetical protein
MADVLGTHSVATRSSGGTPFPSSNFRSYVTTMWASNSLSSPTTNRRPGLIMKFQGPSEGRKPMGRNAHHECRPSPQAKFWADIEETRCLLVAASPSLSQSSAKRNPLNSPGFSKYFSSLWVALVGRASRVPAGMVTPLENVNGRNVTRVVITGEKQDA